MDGGSDVVEISGVDSDAFLTDLEEGIPGSRSRLHKGCADSGADACRLLLDSSREFISLEEGEIRSSPAGSEEVTGEIRDVTLRWTTEDPVVREVLSDAICWRELWASRPGERAGVSLVVDRYGLHFDHRDRLMVVQKVNYSDFGQLAEMVLSGALDVEFSKIIFMVGWNRDVSLSKSRIVTSVKRLVQVVIQKNPGIKVGLAGLVPNYWCGAQKVMKAVNFNRNVSTGVKELVRVGCAVQFLPLHLHFQVRDNEEDRRMYLREDGVLTRTAAFCLRGLILQEFGLAIPPVELP